MKKVTILGVLLVITFVLTTNASAVVYKWWVDGPDNNYNNPSNWEYGAGPVPDGSTVEALWYGNMTEATVIGPGDDYAIQVLNLGDWNLYSSEGKSALLTMTGGSLSVSYRAQIGCYCHITPTPTDIGGIFTLSGGSVSGNTEIGRMATGILNIEGGDYYAWEIGLGMSLTDKTEKQGTGIVNLTAGELKTYRLYIDNADSVININGGILKVGGDAYEDGNGMVAELTDMINAGQIVTDDPLGLIVYHNEAEGLTYAHVTPEPTTIALLGLGGTALFGRRRKS